METATSIDRSNSGEDGSLGEVTTGNSLQTTSKSNHYAINRKQLLEDLTDLGHLAWRFFPVPCRLLLPEFFTREQCQAQHLKSERPVLPPAIRFQGCGSLQFVAPFYTQLVGSFTPVQMYVYVAHISHTCYAYAWAFASAPSRIFICMQFYSCPFAGSLAEEQLLYETKT